MSHAAINRNFKSRAIRAKPTRPPGAPLRAKSGVRQSRRRSLRGVSSAPGLRISAQGARCQRASRTARSTASEARRAARSMGISRTSRNSNSAEEDTTSNVVSTMSSTRATSSCGAAPAACAGTGPHPRPRGRPRRFGVRTIRIETLDRVMHDWDASLLQVPQ